MKRVTVWVQQFNDRPNLVLQWHDPATNRRKSKSAGTADKVAAEQARSDLEYELNHGLHRETSHLTWEAFRELFQGEYLVGRRATTQETFGYALDRFERLAGPRKVAGITERTVSGFVASMHREGYAPKTIKVNLELLLAMLRWAVDQKFIASVPKFPSVRVPKKKPQPVPAESWEKLVEKAPDEEMRVFLLCGWLAGLRLSEAFELEWEPSEEFPWVDLGRRRVVLPAGFAKADEDQWVPVAPELAGAIGALPRRGRKVFRLEGTGGDRITAGAAGKRVVRLAKKAGVKMTMHSLRRGFGCSYAGKVPAQVLQKLMRHGDIKMTMAYYANVDQAVEDAVFGDVTLGVTGHPKPKAGK